MLAFSTYAPIGSSLFSSDRRSSVFSSSFSAPPANIHSNPLLVQAIAVPADLVKVRMQADGRLVASGEIAKPRYSSLSNAFRTVFRQEGAAGLWRGTTPAVQRAAHALSPPRHPSPHTRNPGP